MKILVTGGAGFIGSHIVDAYIAAGHDVAVIDNLSTGRRENIQHAARFYELDIRSKAIGEVFERERFDVVNHQAAQIDVRKSVKDPVEDASVNILGGLNLLESARRTGVDKIIFSSTGGAIYGEQDCFPADESHPTRPVSPYGVAKLALEHYLFYYRQAHGLEYCVLRYANVYGPRQNSNGEAGVVAIFTSKMLTREQPVINGDGRQTRDYVYVSDVARANVLALSLDHSDVFNIGTGIETDVRQLLHMLSGLIGARTPEVYAPAKAGEQMRSVVSWRKVHDALGWQPETPLEEGLRRTVDSFRKALV